MSFSEMKIIIPDSNRELGELVDHPSYEVERKKEPRYSRKWGKYWVSKNLIKEDENKANALIEESTRHFGKRQVYVQSLNGVDIYNAIEIGRFVGLIPTDEEMSDYEKLVVKVFDVKGINSFPKPKVRRGDRILLNDEDVKADIFVIRANPKYSQRGYGPINKIVIIENGRGDHASVYTSERKAKNIAFVEHDFNTKILEPFVRQTEIIQEYCELEPYLFYTAYIPR